MARFEVRITALDCPDCEQPLDEPSTPGAMSACWPRHEQALGESPHYAIELQAASDTCLIEALGIHELPEFKVQQEVNDEDKN